MTETFRVLVVGDARGAADAVARALGRAGSAVELRVVADQEEAARVSTTFAPDLVISGGVSIQPTGDGAAREAPPQIGVPGEAGLFRDIIEYSRDLFYVHGTDHVLTYLSPQTRTFFDCEPEEALIRWTEFATDNPVNDLGMELTQRAIDTGERQPPYELELVSRTGRRFWVEVREEPVVRDGRTVAIVGAISDISDRKKAQERLTLLAHALRSVGEGVCMTGQDDRIQFVNEAFCRLYGYAAEELVGAPIGMLRVEDVPDTLDEKIREGTLGAGWHGEVWNLRKDGTRILVSLATSTVRDELGKPLALVGVVRDVTEQRRTQDALRESEDRYRDLVESATDLICTHDLAGVFLTVNRAAATALGYEISEVLGHSVVEFLSPRGRRLFPAYLEEVRREGSANGIMEVISKWGDARFWEYENTLRTEGVAAPVVRGRARDVTERLQAEHSLRESERRYRALFAGANDGVLLLRGSRFVECNPKACELYGRSRDDLIGMAPWEVSPQTQPDGEPSEVKARLLLDTALAGAPQRFEWEHTRADGETFLVEVSLNALPIGEDLVVQAIVRDVTQQRRAAEAERRRLRQLAAVNRIARQVASELDPDAVGRAAVREVHETFGYDNVMLLLVDPEAGELGEQTIAGVYEVVARMDYRQKVGEGLIGIAAATGQTVVSNDVRSDPRYLVGFEIEVATRAEAAVPVRLGDEVIAVLDVQETRTDAFDEVDVQVLETLASEVAVSLNNARLYAALKASEERYKVLAETAQDLIVVHDLAGNVLYANPRAFAVTGYTPADLPGLQVLEVIAPELRDAWRQRLQQRMSGERGQFLYTLELVTRDGRRIPVEVSSTPIVEGGETQAILAVARDVSERVRAERALRESERRYRELFEAHPHPMWVYDLATLRFLAVNDAAVLVYGWSRDEFASMTLRDIRPAGDIARLEASVAQSRDNPGYESSNGWRHRTKEGRVLDVEITSHDLTFEGRPARMVVAYDVTERRRAEQALRESEERYRTFFEQDLTADFLASADGKILEANPAFAAIFGFASPEEARDFPTVNLYPSPAHHARVLGLLQERRHLTNFELELRRRDGAPVHVVANAVGVFDRDGKLGGVRTYLFDITAHKATEEQLRQAQKMEAVGRLAGGVAHDFNNLLQAMLATVQVLRQRAEEVPQCGTHLAELEDNVRRGASLTRQLLLFARREVSTHEALDLTRVIGDAVPMLRRLVRENIRMVLELGPEQLPVVGDRGQLQQVLMNLVVNAVDAMPQGGTLTVRTGQAPDEVWWEVEDSGVGMSAEVQGRLFEPFFTTKGLGKGTGLGLAVAHGIVTSHGGRIEVASVEGGGSVFRILLPSGREVASEIDVGPPAGDLERGHGERILVVEDEPTARAGLAEILEMLGYEVCAVDSAEAALELPSSDAHDVLLTDFVLPGRNGLELAASLKERWSDLEVVLMSGYAEEAALHGDSLPSDIRYLQKPFDIATLAHTLRILLG